MPKKLNDDKSVDSEDNKYYYDVVEDGKNISILPGGYRLAVSPFSYFKSKKNKINKFNVYQSEDESRDTSS